MIHTSTKLHPRESRVVRRGSLFALVLCARAGANRGICPVGDRLDLWRVYVLRGRLAMCREKPFICRAFDKRR